MKNEKVTGFLRIKDNKYHTVICYYNEKNKRVIKTKSTKIAVQKNKKGEEIKKYRDEALKILFDLKEEYIKNYNKKDELLFTEYFEKHLKNKKYELSETSYYKYYTAVKNRIMPFFKDIYLKDLDVEMIKEYFTSLRKENLSENTIKHYKNYISNCLEQAVLEKKISENVIKKIKLKKIEEKDIRALNSDEIKRLLNAVKDTKYELPIFLSLCLGLRLSEVFGLKWSSIDFNKKSILIENTVVLTATEINNKLCERQKVHNKTKTTKSKRILFFEKNLENLLLKKQKRIEKMKKLLGNTYYFKDEDFVLVGDDGKLMNASSFSRKITKIFKENNIKNASFKNLRSTFATILFDLDVDLITVMKNMGHSNLETTRKHYIKFDLKKSKESISALNQKLETLIKKEEIISDTIGSQN